MVSAAIARPTSPGHSRLATAEAVLDKVSICMWVAERMLARLPETDPLWHHHHGRRCALEVTLSLAGAWPYWPEDVSDEEAFGALVAARADLPEHFEDMTIPEAHQWLLSKGVKTPPDHVTDLRRHLLAGLRKHEDVASAPTVVAHKEALAVAADPGDGACSHASSVGGAEAVHTRSSDCEACEGHCVAPAAADWALRAWTSHAKTTIVAPAADVVTGVRIVAEFEDEREALIGAAAPAMLAALQAVAAKLGSRPHGTGSYLPKPLRDQVLAAISLADGGVA
jgi:hypothetical protein